MRAVASSQSLPRFATVAVAASSKTGFSRVAITSVRGLPISLGRPTGAEKIQAGTQTEKVSGRAGEHVPQHVRAVCISFAEAAHVLPSKASEEGLRAVSCPVSRAVVLLTAITAPATKRCSAKMAKIRRGGCYVQPEMANPFGSATAPASLREAEITARAQT